MPSSAPPVEADPPLPPTPVPPAPCRDGGFGVLASIAPRNACCSSCCRRQASAIDSASIAVAGEVSASGTETGAGGGAGGGTGAGVRSSADGVAIDGAWGEVNRVCGTGSRDARGACVAGVLTRRGGGSALAAGAAVVRLRGAWISGSHPLYGCGSGSHMLPAGSAPSASA